MWKDFIIKVRSFEPVLGTFSTLGSPAVVELIGLSGLDFVILDMEHGLFTLDSLHASLLAAERRGIAPLVRPAGHTRPLVMRPLEMGVAGVVVPMIDTPALAAEAVAACRIPPNGVRGIAASRCCSYGVDLPSHVLNADKNVLAIIQCETSDAVDNLPDILEKTRPDAVFVGPTDLSQSMGYPGNPGHPEVQARIGKALGIARECRVPCGILAFNTEDAKKRQKQGFGIVALSTDSRVILNGFKTLIPSS
jgi:4-hydroxy-2-oxoheptanedioate aldolase